MSFGWNHLWGNARRGWPSPASMDGPDTSKTPALACWWNHGGQKLEKNRQKNWGKRNLVGAIWWNGTKDFFPQHFYPGADRLHTGGGATRWRYIVCWTASKTPHQSLALAVLQWQLHDVTFHPKSGNVFSTRHSVWADCSTSGRGLLMPGGESLNGPLIHQLTAGQTNTSLLALASGKKGTV